jgi:hypothetical protein
MAGLSNLVIAVLKSRMTLTIAKSYLRLRLYMHRLTHAVLLAQVRRLSLDRKALLAQLASPYKDPRGRQELLALQDLLDQQAQLALQAQTALMESMAKMLSLVK